MVSKSTCFNIAVLLLLLFIGILLMGCTSRFAFISDERASGGGLNEFVVGSTQTVTGSRLRGSSNPCHEATPEPTPLPAPVVEP